MAGIVQAESATKGDVAKKRSRKSIDHLEVHPKLGGGHTVKHVYSAYEHEPREYHFGPGQGAAAAAHIARHAGLPSAGESEAEPEKRFGLAGQKDGANDK